MRREILPIVERGEDARGVNQIDARYERRREVKRGSGQVVRKVREDSDEGKKDGSSDQERSDEPTVAEVPEHSAVGLGQPQAFAGGPGRQTPADHGGTHEGPCAEDHERSPPVEGRGDPAREHTPNQPARNRSRDPSADLGTQVRAAVVIADVGDGDRRHARHEKSLERPKHEQHPKSGGERARDRRCGEQHAAGDHDGLAADGVRQRAVGGRHHRDHQHDDGDRQPGRRGGDAELFGKQRQDRLRDVEIRVHRHGGEVEGGDSPLSPWERGRVRGEPRLVIA